jgi:hypothetical protein
VTWGLTNITPALKYSLNSLKAMDHKPNVLKSRMFFELEHRFSFGKFF